MSRIVLIEVDNVAAEDALSYVLALAREPSTRTEDAMAGLAQLASVAPGIKVLYSAPVGKR